MSHKGYQLNIQTVALTTITAFATLAFLWYNKQRKNRVPQKWKPVGKVTSLFLYPLKSGRRMSVNRAECTSLGLRQIREHGKFQLGDRCLVVYKNSSDECRTARTSPKMVLIEVAIDDANCVTLTAPGMEELHLDAVKILNEAEKQEKTVSHLLRRYRVIDCGEEAAKWVSKYITDDDKTPNLRIGICETSYKPCLNKDLQKFLKSYPKLEDSSLGVYSDLTSFMLINQASVDELIVRVPNSNVSVNNFRPNIVVSDETLGPFAEDKWDWVKIGDVVFRNVKACTRCVLTTVNQETGTMNKDFEPLKTLKKYRIDRDLIKHESEKNSPVMGIQMGLVTNGIIHVGDSISIGVED